MKSREQNVCRFVLIRHGQTYWNQKKKMQGQVNIPLNMKGHQQARKLSVELRQCDFDMCYSSPLIRAVQTAHAVIGNDEIPIIKNELLAEQGYGVCEGQWQPLVFRLPLFTMYHYLHHPEKYVPPIGGESMEDMVKRGGRALNEVLRPAAEMHRMVLVGAHASIICAMLNWIDKVPIRDYWRNMLQNCGYAVIEYVSGSWRIIEKH